MPRDSELAERFWSLVERKAADLCWPWYGAVTIVNVYLEEEKRWTTKPIGHVAYYLKHGQWPPQTPYIPWVCHNSRCANLAHYRVVSKATIQRFRKRHRPIPQRVPAT